MNRHRCHRSNTLAVLPVLAFGLLFAGLAAADDPMPVSAGGLWKSPAPTNLLDNVERAKDKISQQEASNKGLSKGLEDSGKLMDVGVKAQDYGKALSATDDRLSAKYTPPGAPGVPSKCMENKACRPCFTEAYAKVNKTRVSLEKVRAHYDYTHRFSASGIALMQSVAATAGGPAGIGAAVETNKVNGAVDEFDKVVANKNAELLARLQGNLKEVNRCEATYYKNDDWYDRYGYIYYQFMAAHYGYADKHTGQ